MTDARPTRARGTPLAVSLCLLFALTALPRPAAAADLGDPAKHLVLDSRAVADVQGLRLVQGAVEKEQRNPLFQADKLWENSLNNLYPNVEFDAGQKLFKLWYKDVLHDAEIIARMMPPYTVHKQGWFQLYATSKDGLSWEKPALGQYGFDGNEDNNVVTRDTPNVGVFRDDHDADPARRYKMIYDVGLGHMRVKFSADGVRWTDAITPVGLTACGDTHNNAWWDPAIGKYVLITRQVSGKSERLVARSVSADFIKWEEPAVVLRSTPEEGVARQTYCMPAFRYGSGYVGFVMMYNVKGDKSVDCELTWSPDSVTWTRPFLGTPFIPRGEPGSYDAGCVYAAANPPVVQDGRMKIFYGGSTAVHVGWKRHCLPCLAYLRPDGFAAYEPAEKGGKGTLATRPMVADGGPLKISADARGGAVRVAVVDEAGYELGACEPVSGDVTDAAVSWKGGKDFAALKGKTVRLRFELEGPAKLYAWGGLESAAR